MDEIPGISLHVREIKNIEELNELSIEWTELYEASAVSTPFQSPAWIINWWKYFGNDSLWTVAVYNRRILVGLAPMYIFNYRHGHETLRQMTFIGTGNTDYMDILLRPDLEAESVQIFSEFLLGNKENWDVCDFQEIRQSSSLLKLKMPEEFETKTIVSEVCPVTVLPGSFDLFLQSLPITFRKNTIRARRQLRDSGSLRLETAKKENLDEYMDWLFRLHNASWKNRNMPGLLEESTLQNFHRNAAEDLLEHDTLRLYALKHDERIIAAVYSLIKNDRLYYYIGGFDPAFSKYSPGSVILLEIMENAISEGIRKFDFLRGREDYKYKWKAEDRNNYRMFIKKKHH
ncbi:MAG: GNAT family N-acetyltransferase [Acidobacteriota bacterium]